MKLRININVYLYDVTTLKISNKTSQKKDIQQECLPSQLIETNIFLLNTRNEEYHKILNKEFVSTREVMRKH